MLNLLPVADEFGEEKPSTPYSANAFEQLPQAARTPSSHSGPEMAASDPEGGCSILRRHISIKNGY